METQETLIPPTTVELKTVLDMEETIQEFERGLEVLQTSGDVYNTETASPETVADVERVLNQVNNILSESIEELPLEQREVFNKLQSERTKLNGESEQNFASRIKEELDLDWLQPRGSRLEWKKSNPISTEPKPKSKAKPELIMEAVKLGDDSMALQHTRNQMSRPLRNNDMGFGNCFEGHEIRPISNKSVKDIDRIQADLMAQGNATLVQVEGGQREQIIMLRDSKWQHRRNASSKFIKHYEETTEKKYYPEHTEAPIDKEETEGTKQEKTVVYERECSGCEKTFKSSHAEGNCYSCTLDSLTRDMPPEEGDFNTAKITSGEMTDEEWKNLQKDLKSVELQTSLRE